MKLYNVKKQNYTYKAGTASKVETAGFIPHDIRIKNLIDAGKRLIANRKSSNYYDYPNGVYDDDEPIKDITRRPNYDMADAFQDTLTINERLKLKQKALKKSTGTDKVLDEPAKEPEKTAEKP